MANFKTHLSFGVILGAILAAGGYGMRFLNLIQVVVVFVLTMIFSSLPDIDSDNAKPTQILFGILGIAVPVLMFQYLPREQLKTEELFCYMLFSFLFFQYILAWIFFRFTAHRGIYHSIPAAVIGAELIYLIFQNSAPNIKLFFAAAAGSGYLLHLILDEIFSVDILGMRLKKSAGTALCFKSESIISTILAYLILIGLGVWIAMDALR